MKTRRHDRTVDPDYEVSYGQETPHCQRCGGANYKDGGDITCLQCGAVTYLQPPKIEIGGVEPSRWAKHRTAMFRAQRQTRIRARRIVARALYRRGVSAVEIANAWGMSRRGVNHWLKGAKR